MQTRPRYRISVLGAGYAGQVTAAGLADLGHKVICADINAELISRLHDLDLVIHEPGLESLMHKSVKKGRLIFNPAVAETARHSDILFVCVGTPSASDGSLNRTYVFQVAQMIAAVIDSPKTVVIKSTVPPGTNAALCAYFVKHCLYPVRVVSNPEFLAEGSAVRDFLHPDRIVIGSEDEIAIGQLRAIYEPLVDPDFERIVVTKPENAELAKLVSNLILAMRISTSNEVSRACVVLNADVTEVMKIVGRDSRIGSSFLGAGLGFGGSCFKKDIQALIRLCEGFGVTMGLARQVLDINTCQRDLFLGTIIEHFDNSLADETLAVWGLAFKPGTDDIREAPSVDLIRGLLKAGARVRATDPAATERAAHVLRHPRLEYSTDPYAILDDCSALIIATEWPLYRKPDFERLKQVLRRPVIFDGRNLFDPSRMRDLGFTYYSVGRPPVVCEENVTGSGCEACVLQSATLA